MNGIIRAIVLCCCLYQVSAARAAEQTSISAQHAVEQTAKQPQTFVRPSENSITSTCYPGSEHGLSCEGISAKASVSQAKDAHNQASFSWWQLGIGFVTLISAVIAAAFAGSAAYHTKRSADISQDASRAWVVCEDICLRGRVGIGHVPGLGEQYEISADVILTNVGSGLARNVRTHVDIVSAQSVIFEPAWAAIQQKTIERFETFAMPNRTLAMPISPGQTVRQRFGWGGPSSDYPTAQEVMHGSFYFIGYLDYQDHFGRYQHARFAFHPDGDSVRRWDLITLVRAGNIGDAS